MRALIAIMDIGLLAGRAIGLQAITHVHGLLAIIAMRLCILIGSFLLGRIIFFVLVGNY
jgi:hypothetical protein